MATRDQLLDDIDHLGDVVGGAWLHRRLQASERLHIRLELLLRAFGDGADGIVQRKAGWSRSARALILSSTSVMLRA